MGAPGGSPESLGQLLVAWEAQTAIHAGLLGVDAYDQPGVEAGKKAAASILDLRAKVRKAVLTGGFRSAGQIAAAIEAPEQVEAVFRLLEYMAANDPLVKKEAGERFCDATYGAAQ